MPEAWQLVWMKKKNVCPKKNTKTENVIKLRVQVDEFNYAEAGSSN